MYTEEDLYIITEKIIQKSIIASKDSFQIVWCNNSEVM